MQRNPPESSPSTSRGGGTFRALRHPYYRTLWIGVVASALGTWMQIVAQSLLVLRITGNSALALGTVSLAQASAFFIFAPMGGTFVDRHDKRRLLFRTQTLLMVSAFTLATLTATGAIRLWMIIVLAFTSGALLSFDQPARASLAASACASRRSHQRYFSPDAGVQCGFHRRSTVRRNSGRGGWLGGRFCLEWMQLSGGDRLAFLVASGTDQRRQRHRPALRKHGPRCGRCWR